MPSWNEYRSTARARGSLALELFVIESSAKVPERLPEMLQAHLAYQAELEAAGVLVLAGPLSDETGEQMTGSGLIIYRAESLEAARGIAEADPMHKEGVREFTLRKWLVNEGSLQLNVSLSAQSVKLA